MTDYANEDCTRRTFVRSAGATVGIMAVAGCKTGGGSNKPTLASGAGALTNTEGADTIRVGLIGCGGRGSGVSLRFLAHRRRPVSYSHLTLPTISRASLRLVPLCFINTQQSRRARSP